MDKLKRDKNWNKKKEVRSLSKSIWDIRYITGAPTELSQRKLEMIVEAET